MLPCVVAGTDSSTESRCDECRVPKFVNVTMFPARFSPYLERHPEFLPRDYTTRTDCWVLTDGREEREPVIFGLHAHSERDSAVVP